MSKARTPRLNKTQSPIMAHYRTLRSVGSARRGGVGITAAPFGAAARTRSHGLVFCQGGLLVVQRLGIVKNGFALFAGKFGNDVEFTLKLHADPWFFYLDIL